MQILWTKPNKRVLTYLAWPSFHLEPQAELILTTLKENSPCTRLELVHLIAPKLSSVRHPSEVLAFHMKRFVECELLEVAEFEEWCKIEQEITQDGNCAPNYLVIPNQTEGFSIFNGLSSSLWFRDVEAARQHINTKLKNERATVTAC